MKKVRGFLIVLLVSIVAATFFSIDSLADKTAYSQRELEGVISDSTVIKLIMVDIALGITAGPAREVYGDKILQKGKQLFRKYNIDENALKGRPDYRVETKGAFDKNPRIGIVLKADSWQEIFSLTNWGSLPVIKFRGREIWLYLDNFVLRFDEGTECMLEGSIYKLRADRWVKTNGTR